MWGYCLASEATKGTAIATSPRAEKRMMRMCSVFKFCEL
jgi:hypothetical protein